MSSGSTEISNLVHVLRENGDKVLSGQAKLSVNASLLQHMGMQLSDASMLTEPRPTNFQVSSQYSSSKTTENIQFLHDFFQKTSGLKLINTNLLPLEAKVDLSKFKKLKYLEVKRVPVKQIVGLKFIQHQLECIVCQCGMTSVEHLLAECGGDNSTGFVWSELKEAVLSFNDIKIVDSSVAFAPWLQVLDLSHNQIVDVEAIERLPNLKYVNLSFNSLTTMPVFNKSAKKKMEVLILRNNFIDNLECLSGLDFLRELDLRSNHVCCSKSFHPLLSISTLRWLSFEGNPICKSRHYRQDVIKNLHISASFGNFIFDGTALSKKEKGNVGIELMHINPTVPLLSDEAPVAVSSAPSETAAEQPRRKSGKVRLTVIPNMDGTYEDLPTEAQLDDLKIAPSMDHLVTKELIENARATHGDDWLRARGAEVVTGVLGLSNTFLSSTPYDDSCIAALLESVPAIKEEEIVSDSHRNIITTEAVIEHVPKEMLGSTSSRKGETGSFLSCNDDASNYFSIVTSSENTSEEKETSPDVETIVDSEEEGNEERIYCAVRIIRDASEIRRQELFLSLNDKELIEKDVARGRTIGTWSLSSIESVTTMGDSEVELLFDTIRRDRRERCYQLEPAELNEFCLLCREALDAKSEQHLVPYRCVACSKEFIIEERKQSPSNELSCPACGSKVIVVQDTTAPTAATPQAPHAVLRHSRSASVGVVSSAPSSDGNFPSRSSLGSSSDEQKSKHGQKTDSDIEIMSNPSQSSIEVIEAPAVVEPEVLEEKPLLPSHLAALFTGLTESSSSGSVTDSICTAYENSMISSDVSKKSALDITPLVEEPVEDFQKDALISDPFQSLLKDVIEKVGEKVPKTLSRETDKDVDSIEYSYSNFSSLDHRVKLFIYAHLFVDNSEEFLFLLRCQILTPVDDRSFDACLVFSSTTMYTLRVTGKEEGEEVSKFFVKVDPLTLPIKNLRHWRTLAWNGGFSVTYRSGYDRAGQFLILLKDSERTLNFLAFVKPFENMFPKCDWSKSADNEGALLVAQYLASANDDSTLEAVTGFQCCRLGEEEPTLLVPDGAIIVTQTDLYIIDSLKWMLSTSKAKFPAPVSRMHISDLLQAGVSEKDLRLQFLQESAGKEEIWYIIFATEASLSYVLTLISSPWEQLFSVPLEVGPIDDSF